MPLNIDRILVAGSIMDRVSEMPARPSAIALGVEGAAPEWVKLPGVQQPIVSLPLDAASPAQLQSSLAELGFGDIDTILPIMVMPTDYTPAVADALAPRLATWHALAAGTGMMIHASAIPTTDLLLTAARIGLLPVRLPFSPDDNRQTARWYSMEKRPYSIRPAIQRDVAALLSHEVECWPTHHRIAPDDIARGLRHFREGQLLLETEKGIAAVVYSQRLAEDLNLKTCTSRDIGQHHDRQGPVWVVKGLSAQPTAQACGWGAQLFDFTRVYAAAFQSVTRIVATSFCRDFIYHSELTFDDYIKRRDSEGRLLDANLRFHESRGGTVERALRNFRPDDSSNDRNGVLISYAPADIMLSMTRRRKPLVLSSGTSEHDWLVTVAGAVQMVLGPTRARHYAHDKSLHELGVDSLLLIELRRRLEATLQGELAASFFHEYPTPAGIARHLAGKTLT